MRLSPTPFILVLLTALPACSGMSKLDYLQVFSRAGWQHPERIVSELALEPGAKVADLGAGDGYFLPYLSRAVGPEGTVYAVEVEAEKVDTLRDMIRDEAYGNVEVILGSYEDPLLPDGALDVILLVNTYHHIEARTAYFARLRSDLGAGGRVAIVDMRDDLTGILRLFTDEGHWSPLEGLDTEMGQAGYRPGRRFDFLPVQSFTIFEGG